MIDILLVLIVIFMLLQNARMVTELKVPGDTATATSSEQIVLELRDDYSYAINGTVMSAEVLRRRLRELYDTRPVKLLFVRAGPQWRHQAVIDAIDTAKDAGVQTIGFMPYEPQRY